MTSFDHHAELESYNESMRGRDEACEFCGSNNPTESRSHCDACAHDALNKKDDAMNISESAGHSPLPWLAEPDDRPGMEWNIHIVEAARPHMRICFMSNGEQSEANADLIVRSVNALPELLRALEDVAARARFELDHPTEMRDTAFSLIEKIARAAIQSEKS